MPRTQTGLRVSDAALTRIDQLVAEFHITRPEVIRALLTEAFANQAVMTAARRRLAEVWQKA
jgi:hypothetical protein